MECYNNSTNELERLKGGGCDIGELEGTDRKAEDLDGIDNLVDCKEDSNVLGDFAGVGDQDDEIEGCGHTGELLLLLPQPRQDQTILYQEDSLRQGKVNTLPTHFKKA